MDNITLSLANTSDFEIIKNTMLKALQTDPTAFSIGYSEYSNNEDYWWRSYLNPFLFKNSQEMVIAKENNNLVGIAGIIYENRERKKHTATLVWFYIDQIYRGKGISKVIMNKILELANNRKIEKISLMVNQNQERAISLYKKYGFIEAGTLKKEIKIDSNYYDVYIMELFLKNL